MRHDAGASSVVRFYLFSCVAVVSDFSYTHWARSHFATCRQVLGHYVGSFDQPWDLSNEFVPSKIYNQPICNNLQRRVAGHPRTGKYALRDRYTADNPKTAQRLHSTIGQASSSHPSPRRLLTSGNSPP